jgi:hypothetical protein
MECKFKEEYWEFEAEGLVKFKCAEPAVKNGFCIFHHPKYWRENKTQVTEAFYEKVDTTKRDRKKLLCIGYNLPSIKVRGEFRSPVFFSKTKFHRKADFSKTKFFREVGFPLAEFSKGADFSHTNFYGVADFFNAKFSGKARFDFAKFSERAFCTSLRTDSRDDPTLFFNNVEFDKPELVIIGRYNMANTSFLMTDVTKIYISDKVNWGSDRRIFDERRADAGEDHVYYEHVATVYRRLRQNLESKMRYVEAGRFFIGEMECKRKSVRVKNPVLRWIRTNILSALAWYKYMSKYGESYSRVILWIALTPTVAALLKTVTQTLHPHQFITNLLQNLQNSIFAFFQLKTDTSEELGLRIISLLFMGQLYISLRRQFERRYKG